MAWKVGQEWIANGPLPELMGIVNCTPDSFFDGGKRPTIDLQEDFALSLLDEGARILDIGGESTRPGSCGVGAQEELDRVAPLLERLVRHQKSRPFWLSIDTVKHPVAKAALDLGVQIVNDISMCRHDPDMGVLIAQTGASVVLSHMRGEPQNMQVNPLYTDCVDEVKNELIDATLGLMRLGVAQERICLDPGIGFGKRLEDNYALIRNAREFVALGFPILYGLSRKSYIAKTPGLETSDRLVPSIVSALHVVQQGVQLLRVHDVRATYEAITMWNVLHIST